MIRIVITFDPKNERQAVEICQRRSSTLYTLVLRYIPNGIRRRSIVLVAEARLGTAAYYRAVDDTLAKNGQVQAIDMPHRAQQLPAAKYKNTVDRLSTLVTHQTELAKLAGLSTRWRQGLPGGVQNIGLSFNDIAFDMPWNEKIALWLKTQQLSTNDPHAYAKHGLRNLLEANRSDEQRKAARRAGRFIEHASTFIDNASLGNPGTISLAVQLHHFVPLAERLRANGYRSDANSIMWLPCAGMPN